PACSVACSRPSPASPRSPTTTISLKTRAAHATTSSSATLTRSAARTAAAGVCRRTSTPPGASATRGSRALASCHARPTGTVARPAWRAGSARRTRAAALGRSAYPAAARRPVLPRAAARPHWASRAEDRPGPTGRVKPAPTRAFDPYGDAGVGRGDLLRCSPMHVPLRKKETLGGRRTMALVVIAAVVVWAATALLVWLVFRLGGQFWQSNALLLERVERLESAAAELRKKIAPEPERQPPKRLPIGSEAPSFDLPDLNGRRVSLGQYLGKPLVLVFFGADCGFCTKMAPALAKEV